MKRYSFFLALALLVVSFGLANAGSVTVSGVDGAWDDAGTAKLVPGSDVSFTLHYDNSTGTDIGGMTNGYLITLNGALVPQANLSHTSLPDTDFWSSRFNLVWAEGVLSDGIVRFGGSKGAGSVGLEGGYSAEAFQIHVAGGAPAVGDELCIDSTWYPATGVWKWVNNEGPPSWGGPYCYTAQTPPCLPPTVTGLPAAPVVQDHCTGFAMQFGIEANPDDGSGSDILEFVGASLGTLDEFGNWSYGPSIADVGSHQVDITVGNGVCENTQSFTITVTNTAPTITCPPMSMTTGAKDFQVVAADAEPCANLTFSVVSYSGTGTATIDASTGLLTINEGTPSGGTDYEVVVEVSDGQATAQCTGSVSVIAGSDYQVVIGCVGEPSGDVFQGQTVDVPVDLTAAVGEIGGYDFLIAYDNSALSFQSATMGAEYSSWEYFTYRYGANGNCSNSCPTGLVRVVGIAETNNGADHPEYFGVGTLFTLSFLVTNDRTFECQNIPLRFYWTDCGDNTLSNKEGTELYLSESILDGYDPDPGSSTGLQEIYDPNAVFPGYFGAPASCEFDDKGLAILAASFTSGCVFIACADEIDDRGDINLNYVANEVADAVLYSRYFIYGMSVFNPAYIQGQIAASDVNADGIALSVADLVYLIRIVIGDALPYPKLAPTATVVTETDNVLNVRDAMGAAVVTINGNVTPTLLATQMEMIYNYDEATNSTRALVYSMEAGVSFSGEFLAANGNVESIELATYEGATVTAKLLPGDYQLSQNYPNPFNPTTTISFSVPVNSDVTLTIYNMIGQKVTQHTGTYEAGSHSFEWDASDQASGVYFYKLSTSKFEETKKMVLLK